MATNLSFSIGYNVNEAAFKRNAERPDGQNELWNDIVMRTNPIGYSAEAKTKIFEMSKELSKDKTNYIAKFGYAMMAYCYIHGYGVEPDEKKGFKLAEKGEKHDTFGFCKYIVGEAYFNGTGTKKDIEKGKKYLSEAATRNPYATLALALRYFYGNEVEKSYSQAFTFFFTANTHGAKKCAFYLAEFYNKGLGGVKKDYKKAFEFYLKALNEENDAAAAKEIGKMFENGTFGKPDYLTALKYYKEEARLNPFVATSTFINEYKYFPFGEESKYTDSQIQTLMSSDSESEIMSVFYLISGDIKTQRQLFRVAKKLMDTNSFAETLVAYFNYSGIVTPKNEDYAIELLRHSVALGNKMAANMLYAFTCDTDKEEALKYLDMAAEMSNCDVVVDGNIKVPACLLKPYSTAIRNYLSNMINSKEPDSAKKAYKIAGELYAKEKGTRSKLESTLIALLGNNYRFGTTVKKDIHTAIYLYEQALKINPLDTAALLNLGRIYKKGDDVDVNYDKALDYLFRAANGGNANAFFDLEYVLSDGALEKASPKTSYALLRYCAESQKPQSGILNNYALCFLKGTGTAKDEKKAFEYFRKAAEFAEEENNFFTLSTKNYAKCYINGTGVDKDVKRGIALLTRYADEGFLACKEALADYYTEGEIVEKNVEEAICIYKDLIAQDFHVDYAYAQLAILYLNGNGVAKNIDKAVEYYNKGIAADGENCNCLLGRMYLYGDGVEKDFAKAISYLTKAAKLGSVNAYYYLGIVYKDGCGVAKDLNEAKRYFKIASDAGDTDAAEMLKKISG